MFARHIPPHITLAPYLLGGNSVVPCLEQPSLHKARYLATLGKLSLWSKRFPLKPPVDRIYDNRITAPWRPRDSA